MVPTVLRWLVRRVSLVVGCGLLASCRIGFEFAEEDVTLNGPSDSADSGAPTNPPEATSTGVAGASSLASEPLGVFDEGTELALLGEGVELDDPSITDDRLELFFATNSPESEDQLIMVARRAAPEDPWGVPEALDEVNQVADDTNTPGISSDGLTLYFMAKVGVSQDIYRASRTSRASPFSTPVAQQIDPIQSGRSPSATADELLLVGGAAFPDVRNQVSFVQRQSVNDPWPSWQELPGVSTPSNDGDPWISDDGLHLAFASNRSGNYEIYESHRSSRDEDFSPPTILAGVSDSRAEQDPWMTQDRRTIVFSRRLNDGTKRIYIAQR